MKKVLLAVFALLFFFTSFDAEAVYVRGYYRKDGTYVSPHYRSAPRSRGGYYKTLSSGYGGIPAIAAVSTASAVAGSASSQSSTKTEVEKAVVPHEPITATPAAAQSINEKWLEYYKSAAMIVGDMSNLGKVEYIFKFKEAEPLWESVQNSFSFCFNRGCFVEWISKNYEWQELNKKVNNVYNYLKSAEK